LSVKRAEEFAVNSCSSINIIVVFSEKRLFAMRISPISKPNMNRAVNNW